MANRPRTLMTQELLEQSKKALMQIAEICEICKEPGTSWSKECSGKEIDPRRARDLIIRTLPKCSAQNILLSDMDIDVFDLYDGYEMFYKAVFGERMKKNVILPADYKETVSYVIKETDMEEREAYVLMRRFGIVDYDYPATLEETAKGLRRKTRDEAYQVCSNALRKCRYKERSMILKQGLKLYRIEENARQEQYEQMLRNKEEEYKTVLRKAEERHQEFLNSDPDILVKLIVEELKGKKIQELELSIRTENTLRRGGFETIADLLWLEKRDYLKIRNMGAKGTEEIITKLDQYIETNYGVSAESTEFKEAFRTEFQKQSKEARIIWPTEQNK